MFTRQRHAFADTRAAALIADAAAIRRYCCRRLPRRALLPMLMFTPCAADASMSRGRRRCHGAAAMSLPVLLLIAPRHWRHDAAD